jgi:hypothetical protein
MGRNFGEEKVLKLAFVKTNEIMCVHVIGFHEFLDKTEDGKEGSNASSII